jgi:hypothetical protein
VFAYTWDKEVTFECIGETVRERGREIRQSELKLDGWRLESPTVLRLLDKLRRIGKPLREYVGSRVFRGITTGLNDAFVVDRESRDNRWQVKSQDQWIIFTRRGTEIEKYPAIKSHLLQFKKRLSPGSAGGRKPGSYEWYEIQDNIAYWQEFEKTKIVSTKISIRPTFAIDSNGSYLGNTSYFFSTPDSGRFLLGLLNSSLFFAYAKKVFVEKQGGWFEVQPAGLESFPIPDATPQERSLLERAVDRILAAKQANLAADTSALEREIDQQVYVLYGLTPEEIKIVEEATA